MSDGNYTPQEIAELEECYLSVFYGQDMPTMAITNVDGLRSVYFAEKDYSGWLSWAKSELMYGNPKLNPMRLPK